MKDEILISKEEFASLNARVKKLAEEKSYLELFTHLMEKMSSVSGLENTISNLLQVLLENIGGSNVIIYYKIDNKLFYSDVLGKKEAIKEIKDEIVQKVYETNSSIEYQSDYDNTQLLWNEFTKANVWAFPLQVGQELIAVVKIENLYATANDLRFHLPTFFSFIAHILRNEILSFTKLKTAYENLNEENNLRKQAEEELKQINEELEDRIEERTVELHNVNLRLQEELIERKQAEAQVRKLNRIYAVLSNINQAIVRIRNTKDIFDEACRIAVEYGKFPMVWIGIVNSKTNKVDVVASSGVRLTYLENLNIDLTDEQRSSGPTGIAIKSGKNKISNNIIDDDSMRLWRNDATQYGYKSTASFPLIVFDKVVGAFCIYSDEVNFFEEEDVVLLDEMVKDISFAMEFIETENERKRTQEELEKAALEIQDLYNLAPCGYHSLDENGLVVRINDTELEWLGYTREEVIGKLKFSDILTPKSFETFKENFPGFKERGWVKNLEFEIIRKNGTTFTILLNSTAKKDADGNYKMSRSTIFDITERKKAEDERRINLWLLESLDQINRSIQGTNDLEQMMSDTLSKVLSIYDCDRVWLFYPCDPDASTFRVPMEITKPEFPGAKVLNVELPMPSDMAQNLKETLESEEPLIFVEGSTRPINKVSAEQFLVKSMMMIALHPKLGKSWAFGMHQCSYARLWTPAEKRLFKEIGRRLADAINSLLMYRDLRESEERFRRITENARDIIYRMTLPDGKYEYISPACLSMLGYTPEEFYANPILFQQLIHPDWHNYFREEWANLIKGEMPPYYEYQIIHKSGEVRWLNQRNILVRGDAGNPVAIEAIVTDITERRNAEVIHSLSTALIDSLPGIFYLYDQNLKLKRWNRNHELSLGYTSVELAEKYISDWHITDENKCAAEEATRRVLRTGEISTMFESTLLHKDGRQIPFLLTGARVQSPEGPMMAGVGIDITDLKRAEEALQKSEALLNTTQQLTKVGGWEFDVKSGKSFWTEELYRIHEIPNDPHIDHVKESLSCYLPEDRKIISDAFRRACENGEFYDFELPFTTFTGKQIWIRTTAQPIYEEGKVARLVGNLMDITERKRAEESLRESETKLRVMFENSRDALGVSKKGVHFFANPAYLKLFGYENLEELVGTPILDCIAPSHHQQIIQNVQRRVSGENVPSFYETRGRRRDGSEFDFEINVSTYELNGEIYTLANIRDITARKLMEKALFFVAQRGWQTGEENFFDSLAQFLGENLDMDYAIIDKLDENPDIAETIALYAKGSIIPNMRYALKGTPCENVMGRQLCFYPKEVQKLFPEDTLLFEMGVESYIGIPLWDSAGMPIGLIALMSNKPYPEDTTAIQVLQLVATRAAAELERERSDRILRKREYEFRTLAESLPDNIVRYNSEGRTIYVNPALEKTLATGAAEMIGTTIRELNPDSSYEAYAQAVDNALATGENSELEILVPNPGNELIVHQIRIVAERNEQNKVTGILAIGRDITERKRAEEALRESEWRYREIFDNVLDSLFLLEITDDLHFRNLEVNPAFEKSTGMSRSQLVGKIIEETVPQEVAAAVNAKYQRCVEAGHPIEEEVELELPTGRRYFHSFLIPARDETGKIHRIVGISRDITERKQAEVALKERVKHSQSLVRLSKNLEMAQTYSQVLNAALNEVKSILGYQTLWVYLLSEDKKYFEALVARGDFEDVVMSADGTAILPISGDRMLEEIAEAKDIVIVEDARTDERTDKKIVETLGNRTIVNVPIYLFDKHLGTVGTGTFDLEGIRVPTLSEKEYLIALSSHLAVTLDRIHLLDQRRKAEKSLLRLNRELRAISNCNQALLRADDEETLLNEICNLICNEAGYKLAWVGYAEDDDAKTIRPVAWAGFESGYVADLKLSWSDETTQGRGPAGITIRTGEIVCVADFASDKLMEPWRESALKRGYRSGIALPLKDTNAVPFGALLIYSSEANVITPDEIRLMDELANDLAFGIITIRTRAERKRVENELELHRDHLQELVNVRTEELDEVNKKLRIEFEKEKEFERMLQHSLEKEKELSELKSRFISTTSHEFRTPLTTVRVSAEMIQRYRKRWTEDKLDEFLDKIKKSVDYLTKLLDDILTISRSESGKISLNRETLDFHSFCVDVIDEAKISITEKHDLIFKYALKEVKYNLDPKLMNFILLNLLSNAIKYSPNGGKIELTLKQSRGKLVIIVKDQGIGIPSDDLKHLFEPFHRAKNTSSISGTGLGLSIVKRAVELHGGIISVKSQLDAGTTFTVNIPLSD